MRLTLKSPGHSDAAPSLSDWALGAVQAAPLPAQEGLSCRRMWEGKPVEHLSTDVQGR